MRSLEAFFALCAVMIAPAIALAQAGAPKLVHQDEFSIVGIEIRTSGESEISGEGVIGLLWQRFYQEGIAQKVPNCADENVYAVYTKYSRDRMGGYSVIIGVKVKDRSQPPEGMVLQTVPAGQYAVLRSEKGPGESVIPTAWQKVWALEDKDQLGGKRAYKADYEVYDGRNTDPKNQQAELYVGLKEDIKK